MTTRHLRSYSKDILKRTEKDPTGAPAAAHYAILSAVQSFFPGARIKRGKISVVGGQRHRLLSRFPYLIT